MSIGILAHGSLIDDPGEELKRAEDSRIPVLTPLAVEYARSSTSRDGAPTLAPFEGGSKVNGVPIVLKEGIIERAAADMLYHRETGHTDHYDPKHMPRDPKDKVYVDRRTNWEGIDVVLSTRVARNIEPPTPDRLANLAIVSAKGKAGEKERDGIHYLPRCTRAGIRTELSDAFERSIVEKTGADDLKGAWKKVRE
jgi:cation transport regulator ChaC